MTQDAPYGPIPNRFRQDLIARRRTIGCWCSLANPITTEILGLAGLMGAGRTEVLEALFGVTKIDAGEVTVKGRKLEIKSPADAIAAGMGLLTEDRKKTGIMGVLAVRDNMVVASLARFSPGGILRPRQIEAAAKEEREALSIKTPSLAQLVKNLSGGNQQKVLVARWLLTSPEILMIDEPTRGIDVGAKSEIHRLMSGLAAQGKAILMVSSEMPEILGMSDRVLVMHHGRIVEDASVSDIYANPQHPYTKKLLEAVPRFETA